jgi:cytochrome P450 family 9
LKIRLFEEDVGDFFKNIVIDQMKNREENKIIRPDMIQLLMEAKKGSLKHESTVDQDAGFATVEESSMGKQQIKRRKSFQ